MELLEFLKKSPTAYQAAANIRRMLSEAGAEELFENEKWELEEGKTYFVMRNASALIAFTVPENASSFRVFAAHADSPAFKIKENPEMLAENGIFLNIELFIFHLFLVFLIFF